MCNLADFCFWSYIFTASVSLYGFLLFAWWWKVSGHASEVYIYVTLLMLANFAYYTFNSYARYVFINDVANLNTYEVIITSTFWKIRAVPELLIITIVVVRMTQRACKSVKASRVVEMLKDRRRTIRRQSDR